MVVVAEDLWYRLLRICGGSCGKCVVAVAENIYGRGWTGYVVAVTDDIW